MNLLTAALLLLVSSGRWIIPLAAWLSPVFLLRFVRNGRAGPRLLVAAATLYGTACITWWGLVPVPVPLYFLVMVAIGVPMVFAYGCDRLVVPRGSSFSNTLVFPLAWVVTEYAITKSSPYGSWGLVAYTQVDDLPLIQSAAVAGLWGIGFLMAWFASVVQWCWERGFVWAEIRRGALTFVSVLGVVFLAGGARLAFAPPGRSTTRVASITVPVPSSITPGDVLANAREGAALDSLRAALHAHDDSLFAATRREAATGARLVLWSEISAFVLHDEEDAFLRRAADEARHDRVHLVVSIAAATPGQGWYGNELALFDPEGRMLARYHKARPVPGDPERGADHEIPVVETRLGRIACAVCFDMDFPDLIRRAGRERAGLLLAPSSDWRAIDPIHTRMALMRGVENGCPVVRQTNRGLSAAADHQGRIIAAVDFFRTRPDVMISNVPIENVPTFYARFPELVPLVAIAGLAFFLYALVRPPTPRGRFQ